MPSGDALLSANTNITDCGMMYYNSTSKTITVLQTGVFNYSFYLTNQKCLCYKIGNTGSLYLFNDTTKAFTVISSNSNIRRGFEKFSNNNVLIASSNGTSGNYEELYDYSTDGITQYSSGRYYVGMTKLNNGKILVVRSTSTYLYDYNGTNASSNMPTTDIFGRNVVAISSNPSISYLIKLNNGDIVISTNSSYNVYYYSTTQNSVTKILNTRSNRRFSELFIVNNTEYLHSTEGYAIINAETFEYANMPSWYNSKIANNYIYSQTNFFADLNTNKMGCFKKDFYSNYAVRDNTIVGFGSSSNGTSSLVIIDISRS